MDDYKKTLIAKRESLRREIAETERGVLPSGATFTATPETLEIMRLELVELEAMIAKEPPNA